MTLHEPVLSADEAIFAFVLCVRPCLHDLRLYTGLVTGFADAQRKYKNRVALGAPGAAGMSLSATNLCT